MPAANEKANTLADAWRRAEEFGIDMSVVQGNLRLSVAERARRHARALRDLTLLKEAVDRARSGA